MVQYYYRANTRITRKNKLQMKKLIKSFSYALHGLKHALIHEQNFRIEIFCAAIAIGCSFVFNISKTEWLVVIVNITVVLMAELFNTAIENLCNMIHKETHPIIKIIKDVSAAAVVITASCAFFCGLIIFVPAFLNLIKL
jgi:diacylglycerol kinase